jgi:hypothetical protein
VHDARARALPGLREGLPRPFGLSLLRRPSSLAAIPTTTEHAVGFDATRLPRRAVNDGLDEGDAGEHRQGEIGAGPLLRYAPSRSAGIGRRHPRVEEDARDQS